MTDRIAKENEYLVQSTGSMFEYGDLQEGRV